jgi:hypothetical protein
MPEPLISWKALARAGRVRWAATLAALAFVVRLPVFCGTFASGDEATYSALAAALRDGQWLYSGAVDHKPPLLAATYAALQALGGSDNIHLVHAVSILVVAATALLISSVAGRLGLDTAERRAAALLYVLAASTGPAKDVLAANGEILMALPAVAAVWLILSNGSPGARGGAAAWRWPAAGVLAAIAALVKYQGLTILAPLAVLCAAGGRIRACSARIAGLLAGVGIPLAALVGWYWRSGDPGALGFWLWTYPLRYAGTLDPWLAAANALSMSAAWGLLSAGLLLAAVGGWRAGHGLSDRAAHGALRRLAVVWAAGALVGVAAGGRFFLHYYLQLLPPLCLLAARGVGRMAAVEGSRRALVLTAALVLLPLAGFWVVNATPGRFHPERAAADEAYRRIGDFVNARSQTFETLFVWGNSPEIYYYARRPMGTRFPFCNYHSGKIWGSPADRAGAPVDPTLVLEPAWPMLLADIDLRRPALIVDAAAAGLDRWQGHEIARYPSLAAVVAARYHLLTTVAGADIYERLDRSAGEVQPITRGRGR